MLRRSAIFNVLPDHDHKTIRLLPFALEPEDAPADVDDEDDGEAVDELPEEAGVLFEHPTWPSTAPAAMTPVMLMNDRRLTGMWLMFFLLCVRMATR